MRRPNSCLHQMRESKPTEHLVIHTTETHTVCTLTDTVCTLTDTVCTLTNTTFTRPHWGVVDWGPQCHSLHVWQAVGRIAVSSSSSLRYRRYYGIVVTVLLLCIMYYYNTRCSVHTLVLPFLSAKIRLPTTRGSAIAEHLGPQLRYLLYLTLPGDTPVQLLITLP
jgi:hypothetical protein